MKNIEKLRDNNRVLNHLEIMKNKKKEVSIPIGLLEFHPYDRCPLSCLFCTYHRDKSDVFKYENLDKLKALEPKAIVISGGGEPVYYKDGEYEFKDLIKKLRELFPNAQMGLTSNGQYHPDGDWEKEFDWVRVSIDTDNEKTFKIIKDGTLAKSIETLKKMLVSPIKNVGAGYVFSRFNIGEVEGFLRLIYEEVYLKASEENRGKLNIQFRPTCMIQSCDCPSDSYKTTGQLMVPDHKEWWQDSVEEQRKAIFECGDKEFINFVLSSSNLVSDKLFNYKNSTPKFSKCWNSLSRIIIRANGDMYPCVMRACNNAKPLGNIVKCENLETIYHNQMLYHNLSEGYCPGPDKCCRIDGQKNQLVDEYVQQNGLTVLEQGTDLNYFF